VVPANSSRYTASPQPPPTVPDEGSPLLEQPPAPVAHSLPPDFLVRVRRLPAQTMLRIPKMFREQLCLLTAECVEGCNAGDATAADLEQARSKLLLAHLPKGCSTPVEMRQRLALWRAGSFLLLLERVEAQARDAAARPRAQKGRGARALATAQAGAFRKATQSLVSAPANLTPEEQQRWAAELLPDTSRPLAGAPADPPAPPPDAAGGQEVPKPLAGVVFGRLSAPGPTGMRPEHLRDMLGCNRRRAVNRFSRALHATEALADAGALPDSWQWMLGSRLVFLAKKHGPKPRPVRVGEVWRRTVAKHSLHQHAAKVRQRMLEAHQYGVAIPGGVDTLIHTRRVLEEALRLDPASGVWAVVDVDLVNAFPSFEWEAIDAAMAAQLPELAAWTRWCHGAAADVELPCGEAHRARRGAEQGDPHGSIQCGVVVAAVVREAMAAMAQQKGAGPVGCFSFWYCDDGQAVCRPCDVGLFLECLGAAAARVGATRGEGPEVKSHVRLLGHADALAAFSEDWLTERVARTCQVGEPNADCEVLGAAAGAPAATEAAFRARTANLRELHAALAEVNDPAAELTLGRACADVARCVHLLRAAGHHVSEDALADHDAALAAALGRTLGGELPQRSLDQAALGVAHGGLGFRRAADLALPAFVASRVEARPFVEHLFASMAAAGVAVPGALALYDAEVDAALDAFLAGLSPARAGLARSHCDSAREAAARQLEAVQRGERLGPPGPPVGAGHAGDFVVPAFGSEDPEHPGSAAAQRPRLQRQLAALSDWERLDTAVGGDTAPSPDTRRLQELSDDTVSSEWLWALDPGSPEHLEPDAYVAAARLRLGATFADEPLQCQVCRGTLDTSGVHSTCCAPGESTRGHNDVRDVVFDLARLADATAEKEILGLIATAPGLRPADVLTSAVAPGRVSALDVGVAAVEARHAGADCTESMRARKRTAYGPQVLDALEAEGVEYKPLVWSCYGREHPDTTAVLTVLARTAARRRGMASHQLLLRQTRARVGAALARRAAAMLRACMRPGT